MPKGPLQFVSIEDFKRRTAVFGRRTGDIERVDAAYAAYLASETEYKKKQLNRILGEYVYNRGGDWDAVKRNTESGGLMEWLYCETSTPKRTFRPKREKDEAGMLALQNRDIPHSRFGVLYLFGNIDIEMGWSIALEGVAAVGGAIGTSVSTNFNQLHNDKLVDKTFNMGAIKDIKGADMSSALGLPFTVGAMATSSSGTQGFQTQFRTQPGQRGLQAVTPKKRALPGFPATRAMFESIEEDPLLHLNPYTLAGTVVATTGAVLFDAFNNLRVMLINAVTDLFHWIKNKLIDNSEWGWSVSATVISKAVRFVVGKCLESAAPLIGGAMDIGGGVLKTIKAAKDRLETWFMRRKIQLNPGHPEEAANTIEHEMTKGIFVGLWAILKGVANTALAVLLPGAGSLVGALVTGIEWLVKLAWRLWERSKIKSWLEEARREWAKEKELCELAELQMRLEDPTNYALNYTGNRKSSPDQAQPHKQLHPYLDPAGGGIIHKLPEFTKFYKKGCSASPLIPMLTLNSGICGNLMVMLRMFDDSSRAIPQRTFNTGAEYFTKLKQYGRDYLKSSGFSFNALNGNQSVQGILNHAVNHHTGEHSMVDKLLAFGENI